MKTFFIILLIFAPTLSISAQTKSDSSAGNSLLIGAKYGKIGVFLTVSSPVWVGIGFAINDQRNISSYALFSTIQLLIGTIYQYYAWKQVQIAAKKLGGISQNYYDTTDVGPPMNYKTYKLEHPTN